MEKSKRHKRPQEKRHLEKNLQPQSSILYDANGKNVGQIELDGKLFDGGINKSLLHQVTLMYQANQRPGTADTKTRKEVRGGGKKPWRQKGTGRARAGSIRSPLWRHGGVVFGPHPRDYSYTLSKKIRDGALKSGLNAKLADGTLKIVDKIQLNEPKTKLFKAILDSLKLEGSVLVIFDKIDETIKKASRNIPGVTIKTAMDLNALDVLRHKNLLISEAALKTVNKRLA